MQHTPTPKKLLHSKWTAREPQGRAKHFAITQVEFDDENRVVLCVIQAVINGRERAINWRELKDTSVWQMGWK